MKRILLGAAVLASLSAVPSAQAGRTFGLFVGCGPCMRNCCNSCEFRIRQYNAFSPVCSGTVMCDGMMPFGSCMPGLQWSGACCQPMACGPMCGSCPMQAPMCCDAAHMSMMSGMPQPMMMAPPAGPQMPVSVPTPMLSPSGYRAAPGYGIQPAGYFPNSAYGYGYAPAVPAYPAMNYSYPMGQVPYYWNPMGGR